MRERYCLGRLENDELLAGLSSLVRRGNELTADLLAHLAEMYERRLHLALGFPSLFAYCIESLGFSESAAGRRIAAAKVCRKFPDVFARVASGELHLSAVCSLAPHLNPENAAELFEACSRRSARQVEELLAARFPKPDVRDSIRIDPLSADRFGVHFTADTEFLELLERVRALASHRQPGGDLLPIMKRGLEAHLRELEKTRFAVGRKPRRATRTPDSREVLRRVRVARWVTTNARAISLRQLCARCTYVMSSSARSSRWMADAARLDTSSSSIT